MKKTNVLFALTVLSASLFSCSKTYNNQSQVVAVGPYSSMNDVFSTLSLQPKTVTIDATRDTSFYGNSGTRYIFHGNSFQTAAGVAVTGTVQIQVSEYLKKGDMLFSKMLPISNNEPLLSGGEINVSATQGGQAVYLNPSSTFQANIPQTGTPATGMQFFSGEPATDTTQANINWIQPVHDSLQTGSIVVGIGDTLSIISDSMRECNADQLMSSPNYQTFTVTIAVTGATLPATGTVYGYTLYDNYKAEWPLGRIGSYTNGVYTEEHVPNIPVHFVVFTLINGDFYGGILGSETPATGNNYTITLAKIDPTTFQSQVSGL